MSLTTPTKQVDTRALASEMFHHIARLLENLDSPLLEIEEQDDQISIIVENVGTYLIHYQTVRGEIWVSSPRLGAFHYQYKPETQEWVDTRDQAKTLHTHLRQDLGVALSCTLSL